MSPEPRRSRRRSIVDLPLLLAAAGAVWLSPLLAGLLLIGVTVAWCSTRPPRREVWIGGSLLGLAGLLVAAGGVLDRSREIEDADWIDWAEIEYGVLWDSLEDVADRAADAVAEAVSEAGPEQAHRQLSRVVEQSAEGTTILLVDSDGGAVAWSGRGLVHEPVPHAIPRQGVVWWTSYAGSTLGVVRPIDSAPRPWRVLAGRSFSSSSLPFGNGRRASVQWALAAATTEAEEGSVRVAAGDEKPVLVARSVPPVLRGSATERRWNRAGPVLVGLALLALGVMRAIGVVLMRATRWRGSHRGEAVSVVLTVGAASLALGLGAGTAATSVLVAGLLGTLAALFTRRSVPAWLHVGLGLIVPAGLVVFCLRLQEPLGRIDLVETFWAGAEANALRLGLFLLAVGGLVAFARRWPDSRPSDRMGFLAILSLSIAAALHDHLEWSVGALVLGTLFGRLWVGRCRWRRRPSAAIGLGLLAAVLAATSWEVAQRFDLRRQIEGRFLPAMAPPLADEFEATWLDLDRFFASLDLDELTPAPLDHVQSDDLAYVLWRQSPLARADALSAVVIFFEGGAPVRFSYGLPISADGELEPGRDLWPSADLPAWSDTMLSGDSPLWVGGEQRGWISFWLQPLPGFRMGPEPVDELASGLLRGGPAGRGPATVLGRGLEYGLYGVRGEPLVSPWPEAPPLDPVLWRETKVRAETPAGPAWAFVRPEVDGYEVIYLPVLSAVGALERVGAQVLATLALAFLATGLALVLGLPRVAFRDGLSRGLRSYSKRLLFVYAALLLIPLGLLNWLLVQAFEESVLRDQRLAGEAALTSAQQILGDYVVSLESGFAVDTALDDVLLTWLSGVIHYEVNLYWDSSINASSKRELFTAGLLPERIPGDIYNRLALRRESLAARESRAGAVRYLELYAPLPIPGVEPSERRIFLSLPLLAQQEEGGEAIAFLRRRAILITLVLALLAAVLGSRLARSFTRPLHELVEGTRRIAAGAPSLGLTPSELELAALVEAVDEMAARIAEGRERLLNEKQVMERMVENVTSGVVSVDARGRVVMANRLARELLGVAVGDDLVGATRSRASLEPVGAFLAAVGDELEEAALHLEMSEEERRDFRVVWVPIPESRNPAALLVLEDATEVLRAERLEAWAEMARIIAHEIKNPLTPIRLSTEHLREVRTRSPEQFDAVFERCTHNILHQVEELQQIAMEFSTYSHIPQLDRRPGDLVAAVRSLAEMYESPEEEVDVVFESPEPSLSADFDGRLLRRAIRNLVENAIRVSPPGGQVTIGVRRSGEKARISVADAGPGVDPGLLGRIFDPYFSTHDTGTGLGLPIARRVAEEHDGCISAENRPEGGLVVAITIPVS